MILLNIERSNHFGLEEITISGIGEDGRPALGCDLIPELARSGWLIYHDHGGNLYARETPGGKLYDLTKFSDCLILD